MDHYIGKLIQTDEGVFVRALFVEIPDRSLTRFACSETADVGAIVEIQAKQLTILASNESARHDLYEVLAKQELNPIFPAEVEREVEELQKAPGIDDPSLVDLTGLPFVTIDGATSMDLDQAVFVEKDGDDFVVRYALADASYYVRPGTALFAEALRRGASYYLPGLMVPMLPRALSEDLVSLNPHVDRRATVFEMRVDSAGECLSTEFVRARIHSHGKLAFGKVQAYYDGTHHYDIAIERNLDLVKEVGLLRMKRAEERDVLRFRRSEVDVKLPSHKKARFVVMDGVRHPVESYNEQLSLLCNVVGAKQLRDSAPDQDHIDPIYRVHPSPDSRKLKTLEDMVGSLVRSHGLDGRLWGWTREDGLSDFLDSLPNDGKDARLAKAIHRQAVMVNVRSTFQTEPGKHFGVGAEVYARFSAPMREIVGIFLHKELWETLNHGTRDPELRKEIVAAANNAKTVQRSVSNESNRLILDQLFEDDIAKPMTKRGRIATIMGMTHGKIYATLDEPPIDIKVYVRHLKRLKDDVGVRLSKGGDRLINGENEVLCRVGDCVRIVTHRRDPTDNRWVLSVEAI